MILNKPEVRTYKSKQNKTIKTPKIQKSKTSKSKHARYHKRRGEVFSTATIYTCNSVNLAVAVGPSSLLRILQEAGYRDACVRT